LDAQNPIPICIILEGLTWFTVVVSILYLFKLSN
jgi:hypothetical protein